MLTALAQSVAWRLLFSIGVCALVGCGRKTDARPGAETPLPAPSSQSAAAQGKAARGEIAGVRYLEHMTGGARAEERVPMIVGLHPMGGDPADFLQLLQRYRRRARLILPYGHPSGGMYVWYDSVSEDVAAPMVRRETERLAAALAALVAARPTIGKPLVTGFSQGGIMTFALAVTHPDTLAAAFPVSGLLPPSLYPSTSFSAEPRAVPLPAVMAFHGAADLAVPTSGARASIAELQSAGYNAELREYEGLEHDLSNQEVNELLEAIGQAADSFASAQ